MKVLELRLPPAVAAADALRRANATPQILELACHLQDMAFDPAKRKARPFDPAPVYLAQATALMAGGMDKLLFINTQGKF
jgi:hypothetical protein